TLRRGEGERALGGQQLGYLAGLVENRVVDRVDEPDAQRLFGVDDSAGEDHVLRNPEAADPSQPLRAAPAGDDPEVDLRLAELRLGARVAEIAGERQLAAAAEREALDRCDRRR